MTSPQHVLVGSHSYLLVALSVVIAILASYAALNLAGRATSAQGKARFLWLNGGAIAMGFGIWSMHYVGMRAFHLPVPAQYDWPTVLLSLVAAILASAVALTSRISVFVAPGTTRGISSEAQVEQELLDAFLEHISDLVYFKDRDSRFMCLSRSLATHFGLTGSAQAVNKSDLDFFSSEHALQAFADEQEIIRSGQAIMGIEEKETWPDGHETWALTTKVPLRDRQGRIIGTMGISHNITDRKRIERELHEYKIHLEEVVDARTKEVTQTNERLQRDISAREKAEQELDRKSKFVELLQVVAVAANEAISLEAALQFTLDRICEHAGWPVGHVYFCSPKTSAEMISSTLWHFDQTSQFETFQEVTERTPLSIGRGLPGRVVESGKPVWISDISLDTNFPRNKVARDLGVKGAFGFPVVAQGEVVAVLEFFSTKIEEPDDELLNVMSHVGAQLGQVVERTRARDELSKALERLKNSMGELESRNQQATTLSEMADLLQSCFTPEEASGVIASSAAKLFPGFSGAVLVFSASRNVLETAAAWGRSSPAERVFSPNDCWALRRGRLHHSESVQGAVRCTHFGAESRLPSLCTPLMAQGETLGVLCLVSEPNGPAGALESICEFNTKLAVSVAEQAALSFANLNLREKLRFQSIRDPLTGLFNRRYLDESLERELSRAMRKNRSLGVIMLDVDRFKKFNDSFGHDAGDTVLRELGDYLGKFVRREDLACRYGGEEFTLILPESSLENTRRRAEELCASFRQLSIKHRDMALGKVTLSLGVAAFPEHAANAVELLAAADGALLRAKKEGRDRVLTAEFSLDRIE